MFIQVLSPHIINQIAAGEVIERPAAVVKELLENSIDANARTLQIEIIQGGKGLIRIRDDGVGIHPDDLPLAITSHATSKISQLEDLLAVQTLGFRGEALASIASISRFSIASKTADQETAWLLSMDGGQLPYQLQPTAHPNGTTIEIRDLFFNTPARRKFLRTTLVELNYIESMLKRLALSRFDLAFEVRVDTKLLWQLSHALDITAQEKRIAKLLGNSFLTHAVKIENQIENLSLTGWLGLPSFHRSQNDCQYIYLNGRMVRDKVLLHAIRTAYEDKLYPGRQPAYILYLEVPSEQFDVNVHPGKQEVRFQEARQIHNFILSTLKQGLGSASVSTVAAHSIIKDPKDPLWGHNMNPRQTWPEFRHKIAEKSATYHAEPPITKTSDNLMVVDDQYVIFNIPPHGLILCDIYGLIQHQNSLRLATELNNGGIKTRSLAVPLSIKTPDYCENITEILAKYATTLAQLGVGIELLSADAIVIRQIPLHLEYADPKEAVKQLLHYLQQHFPQPVTAMDYTKLLLPLTQLMPPLKLTIEELKLLATELVNFLASSTTLAQPFYKVLNSQFLSTVF